MIRPTTLVMMLCLQILLVGCDVEDSPKPDQQFVKIQFQYGFRDMVDTFDGHLTKDLVLDGTITIPFWLTTAEQEAVLAELERESFFSMPDTLYSIPGSAIDPDPSPELLRVQVHGRDRTVVWYYPLPTNTNGEAIQRLAAATKSIVEAKAEYRQLPPARGGYERMVFRLTIPRNVFGLLDTLTGTFEVLNESPNERRFSFPNQQQFGFELMGEGPSPAVYHLHIVSPAFSNFTLQQWERKVFSFQSPFRDANGDLIERRQYVLKGHLLNGESPNVSLPIRVQ